MERCAPPVQPSLPRTDGGGGGRGGGEGRSPEPREGLGTVPAFVLVSRRVRPIRARPPRPVFAGLHGWRVRGARPGRAVTGEWLISGTLGLPDPSKRHTGPLGAHRMPGGVDAEGDEEGGEGRNPE